MNRYRMFFVQTSTLRMHQKLTKHGKFCKQINQLPTKSHVELENNYSIRNSLGSPIVLDERVYRRCQHDMFTREVVI